MARVFSPVFNTGGELVGMQAEVRETLRPEDRATLTRLVAIDDPSNSAGYFQQKLDALESIAADRKLNIDPGMKR